MGNSHIGPLYIIRRSYDLDHTVIWAYNHTVWTIWACGHMAYGHMGIRANGTGLQHADPESTHKSLSLSLYIFPFNIYIYIYIYIHMFIHINRINEISIYPLYFNPLPLVAASLSSATCLFCFRLKPNNYRVSRADGRGFQMKP